MYNVNDLAGAVVRAAETPAPAAAERGVDPTVKHLFVMLQGSYGALFLSKYSTGVVDQQGRDLGIRSTMKVWEAALSKFPVATIEAATKKLTKEHPEFPPNLTQFQALCDALMPRKTYAELSGLPRLPAPQHQRIDVSIERVGDGKDWARVIQARLAAGDKTVSHRAARNAVEALNKCKAAAAKTDEPVEVQQC